MERISFYECSQIPSGHPTGLQWRPAALLRAGLIVRGRATTAVDTALRPYEAHHLPHPAGGGR